MTGPFVLALDQGTTSSRAIVFDRDGQPVALAQQEYPQGYPFPGHVTHDPEDIWQSQLAVARQAIDQVPGGVASIAALGVTNQRETTIVWDRATGRPVAPAIVWQSRITAERCAALREAGHEPRVRALTGLPLDAYFSGPKIAHILDGEPGLRARAEAGELCFGTVDSFLVWRLTGGRVAPHGRLQRQPHAALRHLRGALGPLAVRDRRRAHGHAPGGATLLRPAGGDGPRHPRGQPAHRRHRRRPDGGHVRAGLPGTR